MARAEAGKPFSESSFFARYAAALAEKHFLETLPFPICAAALAGKLFSDLFVVQSVMQPHGEAVFKNIVFGELCCLFMESCFLRAVL